MIKLLINISFIVISVCLQAQTLAEKLGYSADDKLLIISLDEGGMCQAANDAVIQAIQNKNITGVGLMTPCPWIYEMAQYSKRNKKYSYGVHLTLLSEWKNKYCWSSVANPDSVNSLLNENKLMWHNIVSLFENADTSHIRTELKAQINKALNLGIDIKYLSAHNSILSYKQKYWNVYVSLAKEYSLPIRFVSLPDFHGNNIEYRKKTLDSLGIITPDNILWNEIDSLHYAKQFPNGMKTILSNLKPGVTELFLHPAVYSPEIKALTNQYQNRVDEYSWLVSNELSAIIEENNIKIISYTDLYNLQNSIK